MYNVQPIVAEICAKTEHSSMCKASAQSQADSVPQLDAASILSLLVCTTANYTAIGHKIASASAWSSDVSVMDQASFSTCVENYDSSLDKAMEGVAGKDNLWTRGSLKLTWTLFSRSTTLATRRSMRGRLSDNPLAKHNSVLKQGGQQLVVDL